MQPPLAISRLVSFAESDPPNHRIPKIDAITRGCSGAQSSKTPTWGGFSAPKRAGMEFASTEISEISETFVWFHTYIDFARDWSTILHRSGNWAVFWIYGCLLELQKAAGLCWKCSILVASGDSSLGFIQQASAGTVSEVQSILFVGASNELRKDLRSAIENRLWILVLYNTLLQQLTASIAIHRRIQTWELRIWWSRWKWTTNRQPFSMATDLSGRCTLVKPLFNCHYGGMEMGRHGRWIGIVGKGCRKSWSAIKIERTFCDSSLEPILGQKSGSRLKIRHAQILFRKSCSPIIQRPCWMWWGYSPHVWNPHLQPLRQPLQDMCVGSSRYPSIESIGSCMTEWSTGAPDMDGQLEIKMFKMSDESRKASFVHGKSTELNLAQTTSSGSTNSHGTCAKPHWNNIWSNFMASGPKRPVSCQGFLG